MGETVKITVNLNAVDLGRIDLLVDESFYSNRTDFIKTAIRNQLDEHADNLNQISVSKAFVFGMLVYNKRELEECKAEGKKKDIKIIGMLVLTKDVTPELARATINSISVKGVFKAPESVKKALKDRIQ